MNTTTLKMATVAALSSAAIAATTPELKVSRASENPTVQAPSETFTRGRW